jgi:transcriptional regulator PpsR
MTTRVNFAQPDIALGLDLEGVIRSASLSSSMPDEDDIARAWVGKPWTETVGGDAGGGERVLRMLEDARTNGVSGFREVTQRFPSGLELPMEYTTVRLGEGGGMIAVGKNLQAVAELQSRLIAAQQAREQDYWKMREIETRSRLLFDASSEAVLLVRSDSFQVVEANPAAIRALGVAPGWDLLREVSSRDRDAMQALVRRAREQGRAPGILVHMGAQESPWTVRASLMAADPGPVFLLQLAPAAMPQHASATAAVAFDPLVEALPDAFIVVDGHGVLRRANRAFLDLVQAAADATVLGERIGRWLSRPGADASMLLGILQRHGTARRFPTAITGDLGTETEVEVSAVSQGRGEARRIGLLIHDVSRRLNTTLPRREDGLEAILAGVASQVGRRALADMVRDATGMMERHCIETALRLANGRRTVAAELLRLSRQSLYAKLARYGIAESDGPASNGGEA